MKDWRELGRGVTYTYTQGEVEGKSLQPMDITVPDVY